MTEESSTTYSSSLGVRREDSFSSDCGEEGSVITEGDSYSDSDTDVDTATDAIVQHSNARLEAQLRKTLAANRLQRNENECMESSIANALLEKHAPLIQKCSALEAQKISLQLGHTALLERVMRAGREIEAAHKRAHEQKRAIEASRDRQQQELNCLVAVGEDRCRRLAQVLSEHLPPEIPLVVTLHDILHAARAQRFSDGLLFEQDSECGSSCSTATPSQSGVLPSSLGIHSVEHKDDTIDEGTDEGVGISPLSAANLQLWTASQSDELDSSVFR